MQMAQEAQQLRDQEATVFNKEEKDLDPTKTHRLWGQVLEKLTLFGYKGCHHDDLADGFRASGPRLHRGCLGPGSGHHRSRATKGLQEPRVAPDGERSHSTGGSFVSGGGGQRRKIDVFWPQKGWHQRLGINILCIKFLGKQICISKQWLDGLMGIFEGLRHQCGGSRALDGVDSRRMVLNFK